MPWTRLRSVCHFLYHLRTTDSINKILPVVQQSTYCSASHIHAVSPLNFKIYDNHKRYLRTHSSQYETCQLNILRGLHFSALKSNKKIDTSQVPTLIEADLEESFVRGSGPGGQHVNKTASACMLRHIPTGLIVKCHEDRSLHKNRVLARKMMVDKLDQHYNGDMSVAAQQKRLKDEKHTKANQKTKKRQMMKAAWKEREGLSEK